MYKSFEELIEEKDVKSLPRDGRLGPGKIKMFAKFSYKGQAWRLNQDSKVELVLRAYEHFKSGKDPLVIKCPTKGKPFLDLIEELKLSSRFKWFYAYKA